MDKILDLILKTPLARRYAAGFAERALILILGAIGVWLNLDPASYQSEVSKVAAEVAPALAGIALFYLAQKRMKKAELTIDVARSLPEDSHRATVDATVKAIQKQ